MFAFVPPVMTAAARRPSRDEHLSRSVQQAVRDDHLGHALAILSDHPSLPLPQRTLEELAARLRLRRIPYHSTALATRLAHTTSSTITLLSQQSTTTTTTTTTVTPTITSTPMSTTDLHQLLHERRLDAILSYLSALSFESHVTHSCVTVSSLDAIMRLAVQKGQLANAQHILVQIFPKFALLPTQNAFVHFIDACGRAGATHRVTAAAQSAGFAVLPVDERAAVYCAVVNACVRCGALNEAERQVARMREQRIAVTEDLYMALLNTCAKSFSLQRSLRILDLISTLHRNQQPCSSTITNNNNNNNNNNDNLLKVYNTILKSAARAGNIHDSLHIYKEYILANDRIKPDLDTYNCLLNCCVRRKDPDKAFAVLQMMSDDGYAYPNAKSYNFVVAACAAVGDVDRCVQLIRRMRREGIRINVVTYNNLLSACCNAGRLERAFVTVADMIQRHGVQPNSHTYNALIKGCAQWGMLDAALRLVPSMKLAGVEPTVITYSVAIDACAKAGGAIAFDRAFNLLLQMERDGIDPNVVTYNSLIHACAQARNSDAAFKTLDRMQRAGLVPDIVTFCTLVDACGRADQLDRAIDIVDKIIPTRYPSMHLNVPIYNALLNACAKCNNTHTMARLFDDMRSRALTPNVVTFSTLISGYLSASPIDMPSALHYLALMRTTGTRPNSFIYTSLIAAYGRLRKVLPAMRLFAECRASTPPDEQLYTAALLAAVNAGSLTLAKRLRDDMCRCGFFAPTVLNRSMRNMDGPHDPLEVRAAMKVLDIRPQRAALESLVAAHARKADLDSALAVLPDMIEQGYPPNIQTYRKLIQASAVSENTKDIKKAVRLFDTVRARVKHGDPRLRSHNWVELYEAVLRTVYKMKDAEEDKTKTVAKLLGRMSADCGDDNVRLVLSRIGVLEK